MHKIFRYLGFFEREDGSCLKYYGTVGQNFFETKSCKAHLCIKKSVPQIFWYIEEFPTNFFVTVKQK